MSAIALLQTRTGRSSSWRWLLGLCLCLSVMECVAAPLWARGQFNDWRLEFTNKLGTQSDPPCTSQACTPAQRELANRLVRFCLNRTAPGSSQLWFAVVNPKELEQCQEMFYADTDTKTVYLQAPYAEGDGTPIPSMMHIACPVRRNCTGTGTGPGSCGAAKERERALPDSCDSALFVPHSTKVGYRVLHPSWVYTALSAADFEEVVGGCQHAKALMSPEQALAAYRSAFENAKTLASVFAFEWEYANWDPEGLFARLAPTKRALRLKEYQQRYLQLDTPEQLQGFIEDYAKDDPDGRLPDVRRRLVLAQRKAKEAQDQRMVELRAKEVVELERHIAGCKRSSDRARQAIQRENEIGRISGFVDKRKLHEAGDWILSCQDRIAGQYVQYREAGGKKSLAEIN